MFLSLLFLVGDGGMVTPDDVIDIFLGAANCSK
jgi:hypothetical protein